MIFYFTGTGNSLDVARTIAQKTNETLVDIGNSYKYKDFDFILSQGENLGFVFPTYAWSTPPIVDGFLEHANFMDKEGNSFSPDYCYLILTCGAFVGNTARFFADELNKKQSIILDASFSVKTVGSCVSLYDPPQGEKRATLLKSAQEHALEISEELLHKAHVHREDRNPFGIFMSSFTGKDEKPRSTKEFYTLPTCTHCGLCEEVCPTNTITLINNKPRWAEMGCTQCYACIHRCPPHAIQYGKKTEARGRYINPVLLDRE